MSKPIHLDFKLAKQLGICLLLSGLLSSCSYLTYQAKPLDAPVIKARLLNKDPTSAEFNAYLIKQGVAKTPIEYWELPTLTHCALFFNASLDLAKAKWLAAQAAINTANQPKNPSLNANISHSDSGSNSSPWSYGLGFGLPIETANKRGIRTEQAQLEAEIAQIQIAQLAWQLRNQLALQLVDYHESIAVAALLQKELTTQTAILNMLDKRLKLGMASNYEFNTTKLQQQKSRNALNAEQARLPLLKAKLATSVGISSEPFNALKLLPLDLDNTLMRQHDYFTSIKNSSLLHRSSLQSTALVNRLDVRAALVRYAVAETKLKLEVAKQYPDIVLSPSAVFDYGDRIWSLGISSLLNRLNKSTALIKEATSLREVEAAQFEALQAKVIGDLSQAEVSFMAANSEITKAQDSMDLQLRQNKRLQNQLEQGLVGRLELTFGQLSLINAEQNLLSTQFKSLRAAYAIEDVMQHPLYNEQANTTIQP